MLINISFFMKSIIWMADIISSSKHEGNTLMKDFTSLVETINGQYSDKILSPLTITLGDEFQAIIKSPQDALELLIHWEELSISMDFRFKVRHVILEGKIDTPINPQIAYNMLGPGLTSARKKLESLKGSDHRFYIEFRNKAKSTLLNNAFIIYEELISNWHEERDYSIAEEYFRARDYKVVADKLGRNRSLIWKREKTMRMDSYFAVKEIILNCV